MPLHQVSYSSRTSMEGLECADQGKRGLVVFSFYEARLAAIKLSFLLEQKRLSFEVAITTCEWERF
eukprot:snap_masked-scaffold_9-processed-gene-11.19-mRNA-1 protein AED:1.00 eAED:1.00 QI:0/-1/0/0/-1/1/1/0/65